MAIWNHIYDLTGIVSPRGKVATNGVFIYYWDLNTGIYRYNPNENLDELLVTNAELEAEAQEHLPGQAIVNTFPGQLTVFNQQLYAGVSYQYEFDEINFHTRHVVFRVTTVATQMDFIDPETEDVSTGMFGLYSDENLMVHFYDPYCKKSTNGSSWSFIAQPIQDTGTGLETTIFPRDFRSTSIYSGDQDDVYLFTGSQWVKQGTLDGSITSTLIDGKDAIWITRHDATEYTDDNFQTYNVPSDFSLFTAIQLNMPWPVAHKPDDFDSNFNELWFFNGSDWEFLDDTESGPPFWSIPTGGNQENKAWFIRLDNGACYALTRSGLTWDVWQRDENLTPTPDAWAGGSGGCVSPAIFHFGTNDFTEQVFLDI